jgi:uncharacterized protein YndB with AHSA1/START domain
VGFRLDRTFLFDHRPAVVWAALSSPADYPRWWSWLRAIDADELAEGTTAHCLIRAPIPFSLRVDLNVERVVPERRIEVSAGGDLRGPATLELEAHADGAAARLTWDLEPRRVPRFLASGPLLRWGQDWVVDTGVRQFRRRALPPGTHADVRPSG